MRMVLKLVCCGHHKFTPHDHLSDPHSMFNDQSIGVNLISQDLAAVQNIMSQVLGLYWAHHDASMQGQMRWLLAEVASQENSLTFWSIVRQMVGRCCFGADEFT